jgi:hypothetical protein
LEACSIWAVSRATCPSSESMRVSMSVTGVLDGVVGTADVVGRPGVISG